MSVADASKARDFHSRINFELSSSFVTIGRLPRSFIMDSNIRPFLLNPNTLAYLHN
jgi:hypothetical protein